MDDAKSFEGWPTPDARLGTVAQVHALGQITLVYNYLEEQIRFLFSGFMPTDEDFSTRLFHGLGNRDRVDLLTAVIKSSNRNDAWRTELLYLLRCYDICTANRNILMHALIGDADADFIELSKAASNDPTRQIRFKIPTSELRLVADQMGETFLFGNELDRWRQKFDNSPITAPPPPLPKRPPKPRSLTPYQPPEAPTDG